MFVMMNRYAAVTAILFLGGTLASGKSPQEVCASPLKRALDTKNTEPCAEFEDYLKCVLRETNLHVLGTSRQYIDWMQGYVDSAMRTSLPFKCDVNIFELARKVRVEDLADAVAENAGHLYDKKGVIQFNRASNLAECANALFFDVTLAGAIKCRDFTEYINCVVRTIVVFQPNVSNQTIAELDEDLYPTLDLLGLDNCVIDSLLIWDKFLKMYDPSVFNRDETPLIGARSGYKACSIASCQTPEAACAGILGKALTRLDFAFCDELQKYHVCFLYESNMNLLGILHRYLRETQEDFESSMNSFPFQCDFDVSLLVRKMRARDIASSAEHNMSDFISAQGITDYDRASNLGHCANAFHYHVTNAGAVTCEDTTEYVKCIVRESVEFYYTSGISIKQIDDLEQDLKAMLEDLGLDECVINSLQIWEYFLAMHNRSVSSPGGDRICLSVCLFVWLLLVYRHLSCE